MGEIDVRINYIPDEKIISSCDESDVTDIKSFNGLYFYHNDTILINLTSYEFRLLNTNLKIINLFRKAVCHETLHGVIYKETNTYADEFEEDIVSKMCGQKGWG